RAGCACHLEWVNAESARCSRDYELVESVALANVHLRGRYLMRSAQMLLRRSTAYCLLTFLVFQLGLSSTPVQVHVRLNVVPQRQKPAKASPRTLPGAAPVNPQIVKLVKEIDPKKIENTIRKLVSFGTRNTLSEQ